MESFHEVGAGKTRDKIGAALGVSGRGVEKIAAVVAAADAEPERYGKLVEEMDRTGTQREATVKFVCSRRAARCSGWSLTCIRWSSLP